MALGLNWIGAAMTAAEGEKGEGVRASERRDVCNKCAEQSEQSGFVGVEKHMPAL